MLSVSLTQKYHYFSFSKNAGTKKGRGECAQLLVSAGANVRLTGGGERRQAIEYARLQGQQDVAWVLDAPQREIRERKARAAEVERRRVAEARAMQRRREEEAERERLALHEPDPEALRQKLIRKAVTLGQPPTTRKLDVLEAPLKERSSDGDTALGLAIKRSSQSSRLLIAVGAKVKLKYPVTALVAGDTDPDAHVDAGLIGLLLAAGSDPAKTDKRGRTALRIARAQAQSDLAAVADGCPTVVGAGLSRFNGTCEWSTVGLGCDCCQL